MREILFRGKRVDNGEWIEGNLYESKMSGCYILIPQVKVRQKDGAVIGDTFTVHEVAHETVGQFTGLYDKNGKRIFDGDILSERPDCNKEAYIGYVEWDDKEALWRFRFPDNLEYFAALGTYSTSYKVIGNIHDNPELLEEA